MIEKKILAEVFPFWKDLTEAQQEYVSEHAIRRTYTQGENIHDGATECTGVLGVMEGRLRVFLLSDAGKEITLFRLIEDDTCMLSASCMIKNITFDVYVSAELDTELVLIPTAAYAQLAKENAAVEGFMNSIVTQRFSEAMWVFEQLLFMKTDQRLAAFLLDQSSLDDSDIITLTHEQIASHMGTAREVVSRTLKYLAGEGLISVSRKGIQILDSKGLMELTE